MGNPDESTVIQLSRVLATCSILSWSKTSSAVRKSVVASAPRGLPAVLVMQTTQYWPRRAFPVDRRSIRVCRPTRYALLNPLVWPHVIEVAGVLLHYPARCLSLNSKKSSKKPSPKACVGYLTCPIEFLARDTCGWDIRYRTLFKRPTLSRHSEERSGEESRRRRPELRFFASFGRSE
jgi:hypothetical protein